eukprot:2229073-Prorocentrum_lima.AAC.1
MEAREERDEPAVALVGSSARARERTLTPRPGTSRPSSGLMPPMITVQENPSSGSTAMAQAPSWHTGPSAMTSSWCDVLEDLDEEFL